MGSITGHDRNEEEYGGYSCSDIQSASPPEHDSKVLGRVESMKDVALTGEF